MEEKQLKLGIIREGKNPSDSRVPLTPTQCRYINEEFDGISIVVQPSPNRCYTNQEYEKEGVELREDLSGCDILFGVKEVPEDQLIPNKTYFFFSHTTKKQPYNRKLLQTVLEKDVSLVDYELIKDTSGERVIAFGRFAGIVGAHNGIMTYGRKADTFSLNPAHTYKDLASLRNAYQKIDLPPMRIAVSGGGRVAGGVLEVLEALRIDRVTPHQYLEEQHNIPVYTQLDVEDLYEKQDGGKFVREEFYRFPERFQSRFNQYVPITDLFINAIFWHPKAPVFFTREEMKKPDFAIKVIADITCDINGSVPATTRSTTIADPVMGYDPQTEQETEPFTAQSIDIMAIDNLPNELPRDASEAFGEQLIRHVLIELQKTGSSMIELATITRNGQLTQNFTYLQDFVKGEDLA